MSNISPSSIYHPKNPNFQGPDPCHGVLSELAVNRGVRSPNFTPFLLGVQDSDRRTPAYVAVRRSVLVLWALIGCWGLAAGNAAVPGP